MGWKAIAFWVSLAAVMPLWSEPVFAQVKTIEELPPVSFSAKELLAQEGENSTITQVTGVRLNPTTEGLQVILVTPLEQKLQPSISSVENNLVIDLPNAVLTLPDRQEFTATNPTAEIAQVTVKPLNASSIRVTITGSKQASNAEVVPSKQGLVLNVTPQATAQTEASELEIVVTGEQEGYTVTNSSVGTRTDTPLRDIPQSIQVIPQQVLEDQGVTELEDALRNVSGVTPIVEFGAPIIRGFNSTVLQDGISQSSAFGYGIDYQSNVEQIEILRGPSSVLYGSGDPGGVVSLTAKQPQTEPFYRLGATIGNFDFYRGTLDFTGPLNQERTILYRLNVNYADSGSFIDFIESNNFAIFPVISFQLGENTRLTLDGKYQRESEPSSTVSFDGLPLVGTIFPNPLGEIPRSRFLGEPDFEESNQTDWNIGYLLEHEFSKNWSLRNRFRYNYAFAEVQTIGFFGGALAEDNRTLERTASDSEETAETYTLRTDMLGQFQTGAIEHDVLFGVELRREISDEAFGGGEEIFPIDIFEPEYGNFRNDSEIFSSSIYTTDNIGIYAQDLLSINDNLKILLGGRFDWAFEEAVDRLFPEFSGTQTRSGFAPRVGIVYQPIEPVSLYAGWSRSFVPQFGRDRERNPFVPVTGEQFEVGVKTEFLDGKLAATLAAYQITRQNDLQTDPVDPNFSIQIGEQRSQGIEFDLRGEPLPGLRLIANYTYIDAEVTEDNMGLVGNQPANVAQHSGSLWAVYEIQSGDLQGLGLGAGVFVLGERPGNLQNTYELPAHALTNALLYYRRDNWRVQLNFENLFDVDYFVRGQESSVIPGKPFTVRGTVAVEF